MAILDWMLKTGKGFEYKYGWNKDGINKSLLDYSANNYDCPVCLPKHRDYSLFFDAIFARAIYAPANKPLKEWREKEHICHNKYRMLKFNNAISKRKHLVISSLIDSIFEFDGKLINKELHQSTYLERTEPKIIGINVYTTGYGWIVQYQFSFKEFDYEPGWYKCYCQNKNESIWEFLQRSYDELIKIVIN
jgi:hypothetical protein